MIALKPLLDSLPMTCDWVGMRYYREQSSYYVARNGKIDEHAVELQEGIMLEVLNQGQLAYVATSQLSENGVRKAYESALRLCHQAQQYNIHPFTTRIRPASQGVFESASEQPLTSLQPGEIVSRLIELSDCMFAHEHIIDARATAVVTETRIDYVSSDGADCSQHFTMLGRDLAAVARKNSITQRRSLGFKANQAGAEALDMADLLPEALRIQAQVLELLEAEECPTQKMDVILMPDQLYLQVHESIGHPLELDRILGDERNYAGWSFVNPDDIGHLRWGPECLNVSFDPSVPGELASYAFDDNGVKAHKQLLIEKGILKRTLGGIESQTRSGIPGVSCARASSWNRPALDRMANVNIEPGDSRFEEMIAATENGIIMHTNRSWSIDDYRNKFQFGCEYGQLVQDGQITRVVKNPNYRGETIPFWNQLAQVGDEATFKVWGSPFCGKAEPNQVIRVGHAIPACRFTGIEVFGGAV